MTRLQPLFLMIVLAILVGCGGANFSNPKSQTLGKAEISFIWPTRTRLIPTAANAIKLTLSKTGKSYSQTITRPAAIASQTSQILFDLVEAGTYVVTAEAFPNADGTGTLQAVGSGAVTVTDGQNSTFLVTMLSTVTRLDIAGQTNRFLSQYGTYTATAFDDNNVQVLVDPSVISWTINSDGEVSAANGTSIQAKGISGVNFALSANYTEGNIIGNINVVTLDPLFDSETPLDTTSTTSVTGVDIAGNFSTNQMFWIDSDQNVVKVTPRRNPGIPLPIFTNTDTSLTPKSVVTSANGTVYAAFSNATISKLYRGIGGANPTFAFNMAPNLIDLTVDGSGNTYALAGTGSSKQVIRYSATGISQSVAVTVPTECNAIACDQYGNLFVGGNTVQWVSPSGNVTNINTHGENLVDLAAADGNAYLLVYDQVLGLAHILCVTTRGNIIFDASTNAFYDDSDTNPRFSIDSNSLDFYLSRSYEDTSFVKQYQVMQYSIN
jgi:hypothetical protein